MILSGDSEFHMTAIELYKKRLENLPIIINDLYSLVKNDEGLQIMKDGSLEKYRLARIDEIVKQVLNNQKQKMLIRALQAYQELSTKYQSIKNQKQTNISHSGKIDALQTIIQIKQKQINTLEHKIKENEEKLLKQCPQCLQKSQFISNMSENLEKQKKLAQKLKKDGQQAVSMLKKDGQQAVNQLKSVISELTSQNKYGRTIIQQNQATISSLQSELKDKNANTHEQAQSLRRQRLENMKNKIKNLEEQLIEVTRQFSFMQQTISSTMIHQVRQAKFIHIKAKKAIQKELKDYMNGIKSYITSQFSSKAESLVNNFNKVTEQKETTAKRINQINNQIDYFIENELIL